MGKIPETFMEYVQSHERVWGVENYLNRPDLVDILDAPVVVFWQKFGPDNAQNQKFKITLHDNLDAIKDHYTKMLFRANIDPPTERIHRIFHQKKRVIIQSVKVDFVFAESED